MRALIVGVFIALFIVQESKAGDDQASQCRTGSPNEDCNSFGRCCARHCQGPHDSSCSEDDGRIVATNCYCEGNTQDGEQNIGLADISRESQTSMGGRRGSSGSIGGGNEDQVLSRRGSTGGGSDDQASLGRRGSSSSVGGGGGSVPHREGSFSTGGRRESQGSIGGLGTTVSSVRDVGSFGTVGDHASICRTRSRTCTEFTSCCNSQCPNPLRNSCTPGELYYAICRCPGDVNIDSDRPHSPSRPSGGSSIRDPIRDTLATGADHTASCKITANNDCLEFKRCCSTKCERKYSSRCSGDGRGRLMSAYCRCTTTTTTTFGRPGSLQHPSRRDEDTTLPRRDTIGGGFRDHSQTCRDLAIGGSCDSFRSCCNTRCRSSRDQNQSCSSRDGRITTAVCTCTE